MLDHSRAVVLATAFAALAVLALPAAAHSGVMPSQIPPGETAEAELILVHGCGPGGSIPGNDDEALGTTLVTVEVPDELTIEPHDLDGWALEVDRHDGRAVEMRWVSDDPDGRTEALRFPIDVTVPVVDEGSQLWLPVVQDCIDGERLSWTNPGTDEGGGVYPASLLTVATPAAAQPVEGGGGLDGLVLVGLVVALGLLAGGTAYVVTGRRR